MRSITQLIEYYGPAAREGAEVSHLRKYSPQVCTSTEVRIVAGDPDAAHISTSYVERHSLTTRMGNASHGSPTPSQKGRESHRVRGRADDVLQLRTAP